MPILVADLQEDAGAPSLITKIASEFEEDGRGIWGGNP
jgi:hypothetical protein